ncbi:hypothetical protein Sjap_004275 [Stephania japonica]|uniref:Uncharacterized protein n=1 Tax=Stephania japonica TaxID=461633 RepID=A0AAP0K1Z9_9MAGN
MEPPDVHEIPIRLIANDTELHPSHFCARRMTKVFKRWMILKGIVGSRYRLIIKTNTAPFGRWDDTIPEDLIRAAYDELAGIRYTALMHKLKKKRVQPVYGERRGDMRDPGASTSEMRIWCRVRVQCRCEQLRKVMEFMQQHLGMNMDGAGLSKQQPPPPPAPPPHDQQQLSQIDPVDPPQQGDNVERETRRSGSVPRRYLALYVVQDCSKGTL